MTKPARPQVLPPEVRPEHVRRPGKKSVRWDEDPEILARLPSVAQLMLMGARTWEIADTLGYSLTTAKEDVKRVRSLWRQEAGEKISTHRDMQIAQLRLIQQQCWTQYDKSADPRTGLKDPAWLREIRQCEEQIALLLGTRRPAEVINRIEGGETPLRVKDVSVLPRLSPAAVRAAQAALQAAIEVDRADERSNAPD